MEEIWKDIKGFEDKYQISNLGRVKKKQTLKTHYLGGISIVKEKILKPNKHREGYLYAQLIIDGKLTPIGIHRLVAEAFIPNPNNLSQVNHKDENKSNNCVDNLEWCTAKYNMNYGTHNERVSKNNKGKKMSEETLNKIRKKIMQFTLDGELVKIWDSIKDATLNGFNCGAIGRCLKGNLNKHHNFIWKYYDEEDKDVA